MIIAIPLSRGRLANHFTKAQQIGFYDESGKELALLANPALGGGCKDKKAMRDLITAQKTQIVVVKQIGERMLGKLLDGGLAVSRGDSDLEIDCLIGLCQLNHHRLTQASEGRRSLKHESKEGCCGHSEDGKSSCCGNSEGGHEHGEGCSGGGCGSKKNRANQAKLVAQTEPLSSENKAVNYTGFSKLS